MNGSILQSLQTAAELFVGFGLVMFTLTMLWGLTALLGRLVARFERAFPALGTAPNRTLAPVAVTDPDEILVVIAAAAAMIDDRPHRIVAVRPRHSVWGQMGRQDLHASHNVH